MKFCFYFLTLVSSFGAFAQNRTLIYNVNWDESSKKCSPCDFEPIDKQVLSVQTQNLNLKGNFDFSYQINRVETDNIILPSYINKSYFNGDNDISVNFAKSGFENFATLSLNPITFINGSYKLVKAIEIQITYVSKPVQQIKAATFANESVLNSGKWYKFGIDKTGVFKLDKSILESAGMNVNGLNPNHINIYSNHKSILPELNNEYHPDDLIKNAIYIQGEGDGVFNDEDYILFYGTGPNIETIATDNSFELKKNINDSLTYFYLNVNSIDPSKRISTITNADNPVTHSVSSFDAAVLHEINDHNLISSGTNWLGETFDIELTHSIAMDLPGVVSGSEVDMELRLATKMTNGSCSFAVSANGSNIINVLGSSNSSSYNKGVNHVSNSSFIASSSTNNISILFNRSSPSTKGWLNRIVLNYRRSLNQASGQLTCRDWNSVGAGNVATFNVSGVTSSTIIWDVTDPTNVKKINGSLNGSNLTFNQATDSLRSFSIFNSSQTHSAVAIGAVSNQNLHALSQVDYLIVTHELFKPQAERLADLHRGRGVSVHVVEIQQIQNEFSCGMADPVAIKWFAKMFYDRAIANPGVVAPKSLLLFGDGSYDALNRESNNTAKLPAYRSQDNESDGSTISFISSFTSDDFFGILDDGEGMHQNDLIDIGVGRFPVNTVEEATNCVNKVEHYMNYGSNLFPSVTGASENGGYNSTFGDWRGRAVLIADDENYSKFVDDCEALSNLIETEHNEINVSKLYLDAYQQLITSGGQRYPEVEDALNQYIAQGALVFNYVGHGGETGLSLERVVSIPMIEQWTNIHKLPLFVSATCEFSRFDDYNRTSAGEIMLLTPNGGAVALLTTTRLVYISTNSTLVKNLYSVMFDEVNGEPLSMGEIIRQAKNLTAGDNNMRNFTLLGDPALLLGKPRPNLVTETVNNVPITGAIDTLKALSLVTITGHVEDYNNVELTSYNGIVYPTVFDKYKIRTTLGQDTESPIRSFDVQNNIIYKGKSTVTNGKFKFTFVVPQDIEYSYGKGKISYYAKNDVADKLGYDTTIVVGGIDPNGIQDEIGPEIKLYMNDENFANGGLTDTKPLFIAKVSDENGINTSGNGIGHDITLILDGNTASPITLNNYYEADLDTYKSGEVNFQFIDLEEGPHRLEFKVWDVSNNSSIAYLDFIVVKKEDLTINHLLNYPNPFTTHTEFYFEHNQVFNSLEAKIEVFTVSGKLVKTIFQNVNTFAFRSEGVSWDGRDDYGDKLARGVYVYRLSITTPDGEKGEKIEKLVIL